MPPRSLRPTGRHELARVPEPVSGYPALPISARNNAQSIAAVAVEDAYDPQRRVRALARIDLLDRERRAKRIDEAQFRVGREIEAIFQAMSRIGGGGQWLEGDRIDAASTAALATMLGIERAQMVNAFLRWLVRHLGLRDTRMLWLVLGHGYSFALMSAAWGNGSTRGAHYMADRFRDALAVLAEAKAAKGRALR